MITDKLEIEKLLSRLTTYIANKLHLSTIAAVGAVCMSKVANAENGGYPPTQNGDIRSLFWLFSLMALQN